MKTIVHAIGTLAYFAAFVCAVLIILAIDFIFYGDLPVCMQGKSYSKSKYPSNEKPSNQKTIQTHSR